VLENSLDCERIVNIDPIGKLAPSASATAPEYWTAFPDTHPTPAYRLRILRCSAAGRYRPALRRDSDAEYSPRLMIDDDPGGRVVRRPLLPKLRAGADIPDRDAIMLAVNAKAPAE